MPSEKPAPCVHRSRFGKNVVALRKKRQLTQEQLAEMVGVSTRYLQSIEAGEYWPTLPNLLKLKKTFKVTWDQLLENC